MTQAERRALTILSDGGRAPVIKPGTRVQRREITYPVAERLVVAGHAKPVTHDAVAHPDIMGEIVITPAGQKALARPIPETPVYLHARDGLTTLKGSAAAGEPEVIDPNTLDTWWTEQAALRRAQAEDVREQARRARRQAIAA